MGGRDNRDSRDNRDDRCGAALAVLARNGGRGRTSWYITPFRGTQGVALECLPATAGVCRAPLGLIFTSLRETSPPLSVYSVYSVVPSPPSCAHLRNLRLP